LSSDNEVVVSIEKASFLYITNSEAPGKLKSGPSQNVVCASNQPIVGAANGKLPISSPSSRVQVSPGLAKGLAFDESSVVPCVDMLGPLPQPITTYHDALTSDKLPFSHVLILVSVTPLPSAATLKFLKILSKF